MSANNSTSSNLDMIEKILNIIKKTKTNDEFVEVFLKNVQKK